MSAEGAMVAKWREALPDNCPPGNAGPLAPQTLLRLVGPGPVTEGDFASHTALGVPCTQPGKECEWSSCSMFLSSIEQHKLAGMLRFKRLKTRDAVAFVYVDHNGGVATIEDKHVNFWMHAAYKPTENVVNVVKLDDYKPE